MTNMKLVKMASPRPIGLWNASMRPSAARRSSACSPPPRPPPPRGEPARGLRFEPPVGRPVVPAAPEGVGQVLLVHPRLGRVVRVLVARAVAQLLHERGRRVADVQRDGVGRGPGAARRRGAAGGAGPRG